MNLVSSPDPTTHAKEGFGDIGADSLLCKLSNHMTICMFVLEYVRSHDGAPDQENASMSPDPFLACVVGSGNETIVFQNY